MNTGGAGLPLGGAKDEVNGKRRRAKQRVTGAVHSDCERACQCSVAGTWCSAGVWWYRIRLTHTSTPLGQDVLGAIPLFRWSLVRCGGPGQDISTIIMQRAVHQETPLAVRALGSGRSRASILLPSSCLNGSRMCKVAVLLCIEWREIFL